ncbi:PEGA domain-containing protein [Treponema sp. UBA785]|uniref:PEGA domain-containing protein n=1 Tax=Treponema sp. UBA785 TaxID=1947757 RepID=UPI0025DCD7D7|nr:PEGA domain-containing protein [Treponema sp. UBA785]
MNLKKIGANVTAGILLVIFCASCVTQTRVNFLTDVDGAEVYVDGEKIGTTPVQKKLSNAVWKDPDILIKKEGYKDLYTGLNKEIKGVNLVSGLLLWWPSLFWVYGPKKNQSYMLMPSANSVQDSVNE